MKIKYTGDRADGFDVPLAGIVEWKPGETREVPDELAASLLERKDEFEEVY